MNIASIFRRENVSVGVEVGKEILEIAADGKVTIRECLQSGEDVAQCALSAYGKSDEVMFTPTEQQVEMARVIDAKLDRVKHRIHAAMQDGVTYSEAVSVIGKSSQEIAELFADIDAPIIGGEIHE